MKMIYPFLNPSEGFTKEFRRFTLCRRVQESYPIPTKSLLDQSKTQKGFTRSIQYPKRVYQINLKPKKGLLDQSKTQKGFRRSIQYLKWVQTQVQKTSQLSHSNFCRLYTHQRSKQAWPACLSLSSASLSWPVYFFTCKYHDDFSTKNEGCLEKKK